MLYQVKKQLPWCIPYSMCSEMCVVSSVSQMWAAGGPDFAWAMALNSREIGTTGLHLYLTLRYMYLIFTFIQLHSLHTACPQTIASTAAELCNHSQTQAVVKSIQSKLRRSEPSDF